MLSSLETAEKDSIISELNCLLDNAVEKSDDTWDEINDDSIFFDIKNKILALTV